MLRSSSRSRPVTSSLHSGSPCPAISRVEHNP
jgi:hypothetical protein